MLAKYVIETVDNSTQRKLGRKLDKETRQNFFPTLNQNKAIT